MHFIVKTVVMIAQWDSSLSVLPVVMIAQWNSSLSVLPVARVRFPATAEYYKGFFPGWSHSHRVTFSMGHAGASRKSPNDAPWETLSLRLSRPISAPLLTVARSWRHEKKIPLFHSGTRAYYHRQCLSQMANTAGLHYFKCPLCNNKEEFQAKLMQYGIYIPDRYCFLRLPGSLEFSNCCDVQA